MNVGVLALQGDFSAHSRILRAFGVQTTPVRTAEELDAVNALVIPGGESTAIYRLMQGEGLSARIKQRVAGGMALLATCAGVILLAVEVAPEQPSLAVLDVQVQRNAYGRQVASAVVEVTLEHQLGKPPQMEGVFIRAPRVTRVGEAVEVLGRRENDPVLLRQDRIIAATFHPELSTDLRVHRLFVQIAEDNHG